MKTRSAFGQGKMSGALYTEYRPEYSFIIKENPDPPSENPLAPFLRQMKLPCLCNLRENGMVHAPRGSTAFQQTFISLLPALPDHSTAI
ncbi:hypothetical protein [Ottowia sp. oral taxon 894]|uniref:hypothetical protein n=1 Tax=Ottowia sp. oral taxon 894 TaxID=1658672 RepID=UPI0012E1F5A5|nr:hypothetical protein [Ottowia sp. oral taxon 894]